MRASFRRLIGDDIFVSYSRADGLRYATALANELTRRGFACRIDQYDTLPGRDIPDYLRRSIRGCRMMVVVASDGAAASERVRQEIAEFLKPPRRGQLLLICFGEALSSAVWQSLTLGLPQNSEHGGMLEQGRPTTSVVDLIANSFQFRKRNRRMLQVLASLIAAIVLAIVAGTVRVSQVATQLGQVSTERDRAATERARAIADRNRAADERNRLGVENSKQRLELQASTEERDRVTKDLQVQQAEVSRQTNVNAALRAIGDVEARRLSRGYASPEDVLAVLTNAAPLRVAGRRVEAQAALAEMFPLQPRLIAALTDEGALGPIVAIGDGRRFVIGGARTRVWDTSSGHAVASLPEHAFFIAVSANSARFLTVTREGEFRVRDARSLDIVGQWSCRVSRESPRFALNPDGSVALVACENELRTVDVATGTTQTRVPQGGYLSDLRLGKPDEYIAIVNNVGDDLDYKFSLYNARDGKRATEGHCGSPRRAYVMDPFATRMTKSCDHAGLAGDSLACVMEVCRLGADKADYKLPTQARAIAAFSGDGRKLATSEGGLVRVWNAITGAPLSSLGLRLETRQLRFSPDGSRLAGLAGRLVWMNDATTGDLSMMIDVAPNVELLAVSGDGRVVATGVPFRGPMQLWTPAVSGSTAVAFGGAAIDASFSPDGRYLIAVGREIRASDLDWYRVWDRTSRAQVAYVSDDPEDERKDRERAAATLAKYQRSGSDPSDDEFLRRSLPANTRYRIADGGRLVVSGFGSSATLWDLRRKTKVSVAVPLKDNSHPVILSDGRYVVPDGSTVVNLQNGDVIFKADRPVLAVTRSGFAATGEFGLVRIWRMATGDAEARIRVREDPRAVSFSPDEKEIAIASGPRVETWQWRLEDLITAACELILSNRAAAPWTTLAADRRYQEACAANAR